LPPHQTGTSGKRPLTGGWSRLTFDPTPARQGGLIVVLGGLTYLAVTAFYLVVASMIGSDGVGYGALLWAFDIVEIFVTLSFAVGLVSLYALLRRRSILGLLGLASIFLTVLVSAWPEMYFTCANTILVCATISLSHLGSEQSFLVFGAWAAKLLLATSIFLLGVATFRARVLGRWRALPCVVAVLNIAWATIITLSLGWAQISWPLFGLFATLRSLSWVLLGGALRFHGTREDTAVSQDISTN
jgi:hypothetical protein